MLVVAMSFRFTLLVAMVLLALASSAKAEKPFHGGSMDSKAEVLYRSGLEAYDAHDYTVATRDFEAAMAIDRHRNILFALAQTLRLSGDCWKANGMFHRFVASSPSEEEVKAAKTLIDECTEILRRERERNQEAFPDESHELSTNSESDGLGAPAHLDANEFGVTNSLPRPRWYDDTLGLTLASTGLLSIAAGTGFALSSQGAAHRARQARNYLDFETLADKSGRHRVIAIVATAAGGSLLVGGIVRLLLVSSESQRGSHLSLRVSEQQRTIGLEGSF